MTESPVFQADTLLPPLYARWVTSLLKGRIPQETLATCGDCAMCGANPAERARHVRYFNPSVKCCTYTPSLPNYLVGSILLDPEVDPTGRKSVLERLQKRVGVTPLSLAVSTDYALRYDSMESEAFGQAPQMRCPHYLDREGGLCGIWRHRNSICSTWFCKLIRGQVGETFWKALRDMLLHVEDAVSVWAASQMGCNLKTLQLAVGEAENAGTLSRHDLAETVDRAEYEELWGEWSGREAEYYQGCARIVKGLDWREVEGIGGAVLSAHGRIVLDHFGKLSHRAIPPALELDECELLCAGSGRIHVNGYSPTDPLEISPLLIRVLPYFDGSRTEDILKRVAQEERIEIDSELLIRLLDYKIIRECKVRVGDGPGKPAE